MTSKHEIPTGARLERVHESIENANKVINDLKQLQLKGQVLQTMSKADEEGSQVENSENASKCKTSLQALSHTKLDVGELVELDRGLQHIKWVQIIQEIANKVAAVPHIEDKKVKTSSKELRFNDESDWKDNFSKVVNCHKMIVTIVLSLLNSSCINLRNYALGVLIYIRRRFIISWKQLLMEQMECVKYPQCILPPSHQDVDDLGQSSQSSSMTEDVTAIRKFKCIYRILVDMKIEDHRILDRLPNELKDCDPCDILLEPLKKRFNFHFMGSKKTNNPLKPEWYLQQVWIWIQRSKAFFDICISPLKREKEQNFPGYGSFIVGLLSLTQKKLSNDLPLVFEDDMHFSHMIDEALLFSKEMISRSDLSQIFLQHPNLLPLSVLCESAVFSRWIDLERKLAFEKIDDMMLREGSWSFGDITARDDDFDASDDTSNEVSKCVETFVALLQTMTNRYRLLGQAHVKLQLKFVDLQCELLEDMRLRFAQILRQEFPMSEKFCLILNSSQFLIDILNSWSEQPLFLKLHYEKEKHSTSSVTVIEYEDPTLFREVINEFDFVVKDLVKSLGDHIFYEVKARSRLYRKEIRWYAYDLPQVHNEDKLDPSPESFGMFEVLSSSLEHIGKILSNKLLGAVSRHVSDKMDEFFILDVILENKFNSDGCKQISIDVHRGLRAIFDNQTNSAFNQMRPKNYDQLPQVCKLLLMNSATAILLYQSLKEAEKTEQHTKISVLDEFKLDTLTIEQTIKILERRIDIVSI